MRKPSMRAVLREVVVVAAFVASGGHIYQVAVDMGNRPLIALVHAIGLDGLVYIGIGAFKASKVRGGIAVAYGGAMSLAFNWASYTSGHLPGWTIAASMPVSLVLAVVVAGAEDKRANVPPVVPAVVPAVPRPRRAPVPAVVPDIPKDITEDTAASAIVPAKRRAVSWDRDKARTLLAEGRSRKEIAELCGVDRKSIDRLAKTSKSE